MTSGILAVDTALVDRLVAERLEREAEAVRSEGWKWMEVAPDFPYGHSFGLRQLRGETVPRTAEEEATREALTEEYDRLEGEYAQVGEYPEAVDQRLSELETALHELEERPAVFDPAEIARAGAFVSIDPDGRVRVERRYVRPEDERPVAPEPDSEGVDFTDDDPAHAEPATAKASRTGIEGDAIDAAPEEAAEPEEEDDIKPLPDRLLTELTAHRTLALRQALAKKPETAFLAALHALCLKLFYPYALDSCLEP